MNIVLLLIDSLNKSSVYASDGTLPNFDRFAVRATRFDSHFVGSLPCMPARRELFGGRSDFLWRPWGPMEIWDARLPLLVASRGYRSAIVTDHYHYWEESGNGYLQTFESVDMIRGHELDNWRPLVALDEATPDWVREIERYRAGWARRYYSNVRGFKSEEDFFTPKVFSRSVEWLRHYAKREEPFYLQVECFDVHEPFHVPEPYASMSHVVAEKIGNFWPPYQDETMLAQFLSVASDSDVQYVQDQYRAKVKMVDRWLGVWLDEMDTLRLWDDTVVILTTDHGHDTGEFGRFGKQFPHYDSHANIPLFVWDPRAGEHSVDSVATLTQTVDLYPTILAAAGAEIPLGTEGGDLAVLLRGAGGPRRTALYGTFGEGACITDGEWTLIKAPEHDDSLFSYSTLMYKSLIAQTTAPPIASGYFIPGVRVPQWRVPVGGRSVPLTPRDAEAELSPHAREILRERRAERSRDLLFNRTVDPEQRRDLSGEAPDERARMTSMLRSQLEHLGAPGEQYSRLGI